MRRYAVAMLGARRQYDVPRILESAGQLSRLFTDMTVSAGWPRLAGWIPNVLGPRLTSRLKARAVDGVAPRKIVSFPGFGLEYSRRIRSAKNEGGKEEAFLWGGREFCRRVLDKGLDDAGGVYVYNTAGLEILKEAARRGMRRVVEQTIAPKELERRLLAEERDRFPGWADGQQAPDGERSDELPEREKQEWQEADLILCASDFVRDGIEACGGAVDRCRVVPYGIRPVGEVPERVGRTGRLRVLFAGTVGLRKGAPYVLDTARRLKGMADVRIVGPAAVSRARLEELAEHADVVGPVPVQSMQDHYTWADVLLLPSLCEGSAMVAFEAMAHGLPVVCTPNSGTVVRDGVEGFVVPVRHVEALVGRLEELVGDRARLEEMGRRSRARAEEFSEAAYGRRLLAELEGLA